MIEALEYLLAQSRDEALPPDERMAAIDGAARFIRARDVGPYGYPDRRDNVLLTELAAIVLRVKTKDFVGYKTRHADGDTLGWNITFMARIRANAMFLEWAHAYATGAEHG